MQEIPIILFGREYWNRVIDFQFLADEGVIADEHLDLISYAETPRSLEHHYPVPSPLVIHARHPGTP